MALHFTHLNKKAFGCYIVTPAGDIIIFYRLQYDYSHNAECHTHRLVLHFSYCVLTASRSFLLDPGHGLADTTTTWLRDYAQRLPRKLQQQRPELNIPLAYFTTHRARELAAFGIVTRVLANETKEEGRETEGNQQTVESNCIGGPANNDSSPTVVSNWYADVRLVQV